MLSPLLEERKVVLVGVGIGRRLKTRRGQVHLLTETAAPVLVALAGNRAAAIVLARADRVGLLAEEHGASVNAVLNNHGARPSVFNSETLVRLVPI